MLSFSDVVRGPPSKKIVQASVFCVLLGVLAFAAQPTVERWLDSAARVEAGNWAELVFSGLDTKNLDHHAAEHARLAGHFEAAMVSQRVHQIDVADTSCDCSVSIVSPYQKVSRGTFGSTRRARERPANNVSIADVEVLSADAVTAIHHFLSGHPSNEIVGKHEVHSHPVLHANEPVEQRDGISDVNFYEYKTLSGTRLMGSITHTRTLNNGRQIALRLVLDMTDSAKAYQGMFWTISLLLLAIGSVILFFAYRATEESRRAEEISDQQARFLAEHDPLTRLYNRYGFGLRAKRMIEACTEAGKNACLVQIDANKFKEINDLHGHHVGDLALVAIADLIRDTFPKDALIARLGGDEFAVMISGFENETRCHDILSQIPTRTTAVDEQNGLSVDVSVSAGYATFPKDAESLVDLMKAADLALYSVKEDARSGFGGYSQGMSDAFERRLWEINGVQDAAFAGRIVPHYQPIVNAQNGEIEGVEALVRWDHPTLGLLPPSRFEHALIDPAAATAITEVMARTILRDTAAWYALGHTFSVGLNLGESDLKNPRLVKELGSLIKSYNLPPRALAIEVTESAANMFNLNELKPTLDEIRTSGMFIALDDFGTGGSSIAILKCLPCTALKIDKSFVDGLTVDPDDFAIVTALTNLGHSLGLKVIAEGVETEEQSALLRQIGVDMLQGFLFSAAVPADVITRYLSEWRVAEIVEAYPRRALTG